jgi:hypothetical protein
MSLALASSDTRRRLPNRRPSEQFEIEFRGKHYVVALGYHPVHGRSHEHEAEPAEVFIYLDKMGNAVADDARDIAVLLSIARQYSVPLETMRDAVCRFDDGSPAGLAGAVLDRLCGGDAAHG